MQLSGSPHRDIAPGILHTFLAGGRSTNDLDKNQHAPPQQPGSSFGFQACPEKLTSSPLRIISPQRLPIRHRPLVCIVKESCFVPVKDPDTSKISDQTQTLFCELLCQCLDIGPCDHIRQYGHSHHQSCGACTRNPEPGGLGLTFMLRLSAAESSGISPVLTHRTRWVREEISHHIVSGRPGSKLGEFKRKKPVPQELGDVNKFGLLDFGKHSARLNGIPAAGKSGSRLLLHRMAALE